MEYINVTILLECKKDAVVFEDVPNALKKLKEKGILVRHITAPRIAQYNRITVGSREQMDALIQALKEILEEEK